MIYEILMYTHLITVVPCVFLGAYLLLAEKGGKNHRLLGKVYMILMLVTAIITLFMKAKVGTQFLNHFGWIHLFSLLTIYAVPTAYWAVRKGKIKRHKWAMIQLYIGAIMITGFFTFSPGRFLHGVFFT